jgi:hypothetical protein
MREHPGMTTSASTAHPLPRVLAVALLGLMSGIASAVEPAATAASTPQSAGLMVAVTTLIGDAECDNQSQCHVLGIGAKACGGPNGYLAWSDKKTDPSALRTAVEAQAQAQRDENKTSGLLSDCMVPPLPPAVCRPRASDGKKTCQLGQGGASSAI